MEIEVDDSSWPIVQVTFPSEVMPSDVERLGARLSEVMRARGPMVIVSEIDSVETRGMAKSLRAFVTDPPRQEKELVRDGAILGEAIVTRSPIRKGMVMAYLWARKTRLYPMTVVADHESALAWAEAQLARRGRSRSERSVRFPP